MQRSILVTVFCIIIFSCTYKSAEFDCADLSGASFSKSGGKLQAIIETKCGGALCHSAGGVAAVHWSVTNYSNLKIHFEHMGEAIENNEMPPPGSPKLTNAELDLFECWSQSGYPE